jgi:mannose-6-phosphate isomerase
MKFIRRREKKRGYQGESCAPPKACDRRTQRAKEQASENCVFGYVRRFAHQEVNLRNRRRRNRGVQPAKKRRQKARGVFGRHQIGRAKKHQRHPQNDRQPSLENFPQTQAGSLDIESGLTNRRSRVNLGRMKLPPTSPLVFEPLFMERVWGGRRLESYFGKQLPPGKSIGESWEIVDRPEAQSVVRLGPWRGKTLHELWMERRAEIFGAGLPDGPRFPILAKLLDARETLSLQVHPSPAIAESLGGESKSELWYFAAADEGAEIFAGLRAGVRQTEFEQALENGTVAELVPRLAVKSGDSFFVPSGRLHAIGGGNLVVEIQENSDTTYRVFDWGRSGAGGQCRALHRTESMRAINFEDYEPALVRQEDERLLDSPFFAVERWELSATRPACERAAFAIFVCLHGAVKCGEMEARAGDFFLVPACGAASGLHPAAEGATLLRVTLPGR